jgi:hypothetical protein
MAITAMVTVTTAMAMATMAVATDSLTGEKS